MPLTSLLYISTSMIAPDRTEPAIADIVETCLARNPARAVTGALLFTGTHFAQVMEGSAATLDPLLARIGADPRHARLTVVDRHPIETRRFADWSMVYLGRSQFVSHRVLRLLNDPSPAGRRRVAAWLIDLLHEFGAQR